MLLHMGLRVRDLARSTDFYQAFFDAEPRKVRPGYARFEIDAVGLVLGLTEDPNARPATGAAHHFGLRVERADELEAARERLVQGRLVPREEPDTVCCWARQEKLWVTDPDGNEWEVYRVVDDAPATRDGSSEAQTCCQETTG